jgi:hypothetical protein
LKLVQEYQEILANVPAGINLFTYDMKLQSDGPVRHSPHEVPVHLVDSVEKLDKMLKMGWIEKTDSFLHLH